MNIAFDDSIFESTAFKFELFIKILFVLTFAFCVFSAEIEKIWVLNKLIN